MITIVFVSARPDPKFAWFFDSLALQAGLVQVTQIVIIDFYAQAMDNWTEVDVHNRRKEVCAAAELRGFGNITEWHPPKPNVWNGAHRLTPVNWWAMSSARNTGLCYARNSYLAFLDDRCVLLPSWLDAVREAEQSNYAVCGTYEKRKEMVVTDGVITHSGIITGEDTRYAVTNGNKFAAPGAWLFGCTFGLPTEWMLNVNGVDESWDSVSMEDTHFGQLLQNNGMPIYFDPRMKMIEDRTPSVSEHSMRRDAKQKHNYDPEDKTHKLIEKLWGNQKSTHEWNLRAIRQHILQGGKFPIPTQPTHDWFDQQPLKDMV
jgi:hypothetical protein